MLQLRSMLGLQSCSQGGEDKPGVLLTAFINIFLFHLNHHLNQIPKNSAVFFSVSSHLTMYDGIVFNIGLIEFLYVLFTSRLMLFFDCLVYGIRQLGHNISVSFQFRFLSVNDPEDNKSKTINSNDRPSCHRMIILCNSRELKEVCLISKCKITLLAKI